MARRLASTLLLQQQLQSAAPSLQHLLSSATSAWCSLHTSGAARDEQEQQSVPQQPLHLPSLPNLLRQPSSRLPIGPAGFQSRTLAQFRGMAGGGLDPTTAENTWLAYKFKYAEEKPNDLGQAMYAMILTFGFSWWLNSLFAYPPRVTMMLGVVFYVLYMRR